MKTFSILAALVAAFSFPLVAQAQVHPRWRLDYKQEKPQIYTYRNATGQLENYWFITYTIENGTQQVIPVMVDHMMYTETGKDLITDLRKVDPEPTKATAEDSRKYEAFRFGSYVSNISVPEAIEYKIIEYHAKLGNRNEGLVRESIENLKKGFEKRVTLVMKDGRELVGFLKETTKDTYRIEIDRVFTEVPVANVKEIRDQNERWYLNARDMREQRFIRPGQKLHGIAIFRDIDPRARIIEVHISGLWDVLKIEQFLGEKEELEDVRISYENRVLRYNYAFAGDEFNREKDVLTQQRSPEWVVKNLGPIASKQTLETLITTLLQVLQKWDDLRKQDTAPQDIDTQIKKFGLTNLDFVISARCITQALGRDFGYDPSKNLIENQGPVWRIHEWWVTNKNKLAFNDLTGRFEVREEILPGAVRD